LNKLDFFLWQLSTTVEQNYSQKHDFDRLTSSDLDLGSRSFKI